MPPVVDVESLSDVTLVGDLHADFGAILHVFESAPTEPIILLGDVLDRGLCSLQSLLLIVSLQLEFPNVILLHGNHEEKRTYERYTVPKEIHYWYPEAANMIAQALSEALPQLPHMAVIQKRYIAVHGGLTETHSLEQLRQTSKSDPIWFFHHWNDPHDKWESEPNYGRSKSGRVKYYGVKASLQFHLGAQTQATIRAHQVVSGGFESCQGGLTYTLFSAPNYCGKANVASYIKLTQNEIQPIHFQSANWTNAFKSFNATDESNYYEDEESVDEEDESLPVFDARLLSNDVQVERWSSADSSMLGVVKTHSYRSNVYLGSYQRHDTLC